MFSLKNRSHLFGFVFVPVVLIILGAFALSAAAIIENMRFVGGTSQVLKHVETIRSFAKEQKTFFLNPGEDVWARMIQVGQISTSAAHTNPWGGELRLIAASETELRIENDLPSQDCRRMTLYFLGSDPVKNGLMLVEARSDQDEQWSTIYPSPDTGRVSVVEASCGVTRHSQLVFVFRIKFGP
jgi:hypothetical protein